MNRAALRPTSILILFCLIALSGCQSANLISMDNEWTKAYMAAEGGTNQAARFADISDRAAAAGVKARSSDPQTAINFYGLAALAAWKAGEIRERQVFDLTDAGKALCQPAMTIASQPRDCSLLLVPPAFALQDSKARLYSNLLAATANRPDRRLAPNELVEAKDAIQKLRDAFNEVDTVRSKTSTLGLPTAFTTGFLNENWRGVYCTARGVYGLVNRNEPDETMLANAVATMQSKLMASMIMATCPSAG